MPKRAKKYRQAKEQISREGMPDISEATGILKELPKANFDETVELSIKLGIDPKKSDQQVRGSFAMPNGIGKTKRVIVFAEADKAEEAEKAGAIAVGSKDLVEKIKGGWFDFDVAIAVPAMMKHVKALGRALGPKGLMPNPKTGTVTEHVAHAVKEFAAGKVDFKNDDTGNVHVPVGKCSFDNEKLAENIRAFVDYLETLRPPTAKGLFIQKVSIASTMSPGVRVKV